MTKFEWRVTNTRSLSWSLSEVEVEPKCRGFVIRYSSSRHSQVGCFECTLIGFATGAFEKNQLQSLKT